MRFWLKFCLLGISAQWAFNRVIDPLLDFATWYLEVLT